MRWHSLPPPSSIALFANTSIALFANTSIALFAHAFIALFAHASIALFAHAFIALAAPSTITRLHFPRRESSSDALRWHSLPPPS
ncbi:MAG: hypothetical protein U0269_13190 [Polyangiales bacterium]